MNADTGTRGLVALTGATGFLGSHIADLLLARGHAVRAAVRPSSDRRWLDPRVATVTAVLAPPRGLPDDADTAGLDELVRGAGAVLHCAGVVRSPDDDGYRRGNVLSTRRLLEAAARTGTVRSFVLVSSLAASGPAGPERPRRESDPCAPITGYGRSKLAAEQQLAGDWPLRTCALRPPALYGPRDRAFLELFRAAKHGWTAQLGNVRALSLLDGRDAAAAAVLLLEDERARGPWFVEDGAVHDTPALAAALGAAWGHRVRCTHLPVDMLRLAARLVGRERAEALPLLAADRLRDAAAPGWVCDGSRLRDELGFGGARDLARGFAETLDFYRREGWLRAP